MRRYHQPARRQWQGARLCLNRGRPRPWRRAGSTQRPEHGASTHDGRVARIPGSRPPDGQRVHQSLAPKPESGGIGHEPRRDPLRRRPISLGSVLVGVSDKGVCAILLGGDPAGVARELRDRFPSAQLVAEGEPLGQLVATVVRFVEAPALGLDLALDVRGTAFQLQVWQALGEIPAGSTASYSDIAGASALRRRRSRWRRPVHRTRLPSPFPAIGSCARTARSRATDGVLAQAGPAPAGGRRRGYQVAEDPQDAQKGPDARRRPTAAREA